MVMRLSMDGCAPTVCAYPSSDERETLAVTTLATRAGISADCGARVVVRHVFRGKPKAVGANAHMAIQRTQYPVSEPARPQ